MLCARAHVSLIELQNILTNIHEIWYERCAVRDRQ
jgi:hypothetical protein